MTVWYTADTHFSHAKIIDLQPNRKAFGFTTIEEHDEFLLDRINCRVQRGDTLFHLGDIGWGECLARIRMKLRCKNIHVILGNHDREAQVRAVFGKMVWPGYRDTKVNDQAITLCHYPMWRWHRSHYGAWQLFGHTHNEIVPDNLTFQLDVGVDARNMAPISFEELTSIMEFRCKMLRMIVDKGRPSEGAFNVS